MPQTIFSKPFQQLSPQQRRHYIDWVDQHYRAFFVGDVPRPERKPTFGRNDWSDSTHPWTTADASAFLGLHPQSLHKASRRERDPLPRLKDNRGHVHYNPSEIAAWAERNGHGPKKNA